MGHFPLHPLGKHAEGLQCKSNCTNLSPLQCNLLNGWAIKWNTNKIIARWFQSGAIFLSLLHLLSISLVQKGLIYQDFAWHNFLDNAMIHTMFTSQSTTNFWYILLMWYHKYISGTWPLLAHQSCWESWANCGNHISIYNVMCANGGCRWTSNYKCGKI